MSISKKVAIPLIVILLAAAGGGGYYLWHEKKAGKGAPEATKEEEGKVLYTCPMHPFIIKDKPGACPICGMTLVKKIEGAQGGAPSQGGATEAGMLGHVSLSPSQMVMANVATTEAKVMPLNKEINATGIVQYDQARQARVTAWVAGRIDKLHVNTVGSYVSKGRPVAEIYSPDLVSAQQEYLLALKSRDQFKNSPIQSISQGGEGLVASARQRLKLMGVRDEQIAGLEKAGQPNIRLPIYTPLSGMVIEKIALEGQYVNVGDPLFNIADLSWVWVEVEVYENEFSNIRIGQPVDIVSQSYPGKPFRGRVSFIYPFLDPKTTDGQGPCGDTESRSEAQAGYVRECRGQGPVGKFYRCAGIGGDGYRPAPDGMGGDAAGDVRAARSEGRDEEWRQRPDPLRFESRGKGRLKRWLPDRFRGPAQGGRRRTCRSRRDEDGREARRAGTPEEER